MIDIREDWFMNQHFTKEELQILYDWGEAIGRIEEEKEIGKFCLYHIKDIDKKIPLVYQPTAQDVRKWAERLGYSFEDGKTWRDFEEKEKVPKSKKENTEKEFKEFKVNHSTVENYIVFKYPSGIIHLMFNTKDRWLPYHSYNDNLYKIGEEEIEVELEIPSYYLRTVIQNKEQLSFYFIPFELISNNNMAAKIKEKRK